MEDRKAQIGNRYKYNCTLENDKTIAFGLFSRAKERNAHYGQ